MRRVLLMVGALLLMPSVALPAAAQTGDRCAQSFPEAEWEQVAVDSPVAVWSSGLAEAQQRRFAEEIATAVAWIVADMGVVDAVVCLVGPDSTFDRTRFEADRVPFHAALLADRGLVVLSTEEQLGRVGAGATFGMAHLRLWQESGGAGWPEPLATAVAHWYRNRLLDRLEQRHADARAANFFGDSSQIDWGASRQQPLLTWNPVANDSPIGDLVAHAVAIEGASVLLDPDPDRWADREARWRVSLRTELTGRSSPTTLWLSGVAIAIGVIALAAVVAWLNIRAKRKITKRRPTPPPLPGFFADDDRPAAESAGERR